MWVNYCERIGKKAPTYMIQQGEEEKVVSSVGKKERQVVSGQSIGVS